MRWLPDGPNRSVRSQLAIVLTFALIASLVVIVPVLAGPVSDISGFESDDGDLEPEVDGFDWNSFAPTTWEGAAPNRTSHKTANGWDFVGIEDAQATTSDSAFRGGVKQDDNCPATKDGKAPNKDDLKRIYISSSTVNGDVILNLAWVRIPQNSTSASAHIGFEFNQGEDPCNDGGLVHRTAGDLLIVYDFEGGSADPRITLRQWVTSGACEVGNSSPPCWGPSVDLTAAGFAEAKVNTADVGPVVDGIAPSTPETLGLVEFGEAGINLTGAGIFDAGECLAFGNAFGVSRSSGNSANAQMKDLVGPAEVNIANCGQVIIRKVTNPSGDEDTTFTYSTTGGLNPATFGLKDGEDQDYGTDVFAGSYSVTEDDPGPDYELTAIDCTASETTHGTVINTDVDNRTVSFDLEAQDTVDCTFTNTLQTGAIEITKTRKHAADGLGEDHPHAEVDFTVTNGNGFSETVTTDEEGVACVDGLEFGDYTVTEVTPTGYAANEPEDVTVSAVSECGDGNEATASFSNTPLTDLLVRVKSQVEGGTISSIVCVDEADDDIGSAGDPPPLVDPAEVDVEDLEPGTYICTIVIDP